MSLFGRSILRKKGPKMLYKNRINIIIRHLYFEPKCYFSSNINNIKPMVHNYQFLNTIFSNNNTQTNDVLYDAIIVNNLLINSNMLIKIARNANKIVCADGGANILYNATKDIHPTSIIGDLDSVTNEVSQYYRNNNTNVLYIDDQETNDFDKSLNHLIKLNSLSSYIICFGIFGDRWDHEMQALNVIYKYYMDISNNIGIKRDIILLSNENMVVMLNKGTHKVICSDFQGKICALVPLYGSANVTTDGLKWELNNQKLSFGGLVSTSNERIKNEITITTDNIIGFHTNIKSTAML